MGAMMEAGILFSTITVIAIMAVWGEIAYRAESIQSASRSGG
jgi:hypothetical protein